MSWAVALLANRRYEQAREEGQLAIGMARKAGDTEAVQQLEDKLSAVTEPK